MFIVAPKTGAAITGDSMIGEYFRVFVSYLVITIALVAYEAKKRKAKSAAGAQLAAEQAAEDEDGEEVKIDMELLQAHVEAAAKFMDYCDSADCSNCPFRCCNTSNDCENAYNKMLEGKSWFDAMTEYMNGIFKGEILS